MTGNAAMDGATDFRARPGRASGVERRCIVTGKAAARQGLVRFVADPEGRIVADLDESLPGRGMWVTSDLESLRAARSRFARVLRSKVVVPEDLERQVADGLAARCRNWLALARKAGEAVCGHDKVRAALAGGRVRLLLAASDGAEGGRDRLLSLARHQARPPAVVECLAGAEIGAAFGRDFAVHAAVFDSRLADRLLRDCARLSGFREDPRPRDVA